jgi:hypothetical protein
MQEAAVLTPTARIHYSVAQYSTKHRACTQAILKRVIELELFKRLHTKLEARGGAVG